MLNIRFMHPLLFWMGVPLTLLFFSLAAYYNTRLIEGLRKFYAPSGMVLLDSFSPRNFRQTILVWVQWTLIACCFVTAAAMPDGSFAPELARKGALQVEFVIQVNNAMGDESDRKYHPQGDPGPMFQWGTRLDMAKRFIDNDFLPQLQGNKTGITTVEGLGYNMWDLTDDNASPISAFRVMLDNFTQVGAAPAVGANYASGFQTAIQEFDLISAADKVARNSGDKVRFIVLFADGNDTSDATALANVESEMAKRKIHLLIIGMGESANVSVPKYDPETHERIGSFDGQTEYQPKVLQAIQAAVPGADLFYAPPGTEHIDYNFPQKAGGLYAVPHESNLYAWLVITALILIVSLTIGGGGLPRHFHIVESLRDLRTLSLSLRSLSLRRLSMLLSSLRLRVLIFLSTRQTSGHNRTR